MDARKPRKYLNFSLHRTISYPAMHNATPEPNTTYYQATPSATPEPNTTYYPSTRVVERLAASLTPQNSVVSEPKTRGSLSRNARNSRSPTAKHPSSRTVFVQRYFECVLSNKHKSRTQANKTTARTLVDQNTKFNPKPNTNPPHPQSITTHDYGLIANY